MSSPLRKEKLISLFFQQNFDTITCSDAYILISGNFIMKDRQIDRNTNKQIDI